MSALGAKPLITPPDLELVETDRWSDAYHSELFKKISRKRFGFVVPALIAFSCMFLVLWVIQGMYPAIAAHPVYGYININFVYTMAIFPVVWILGFIFVRYTRKNVYPLEDELIRRFERGTKP
jgi:uncharacterized membrane protein (DUF485 family)